MTYEHDEFGSRHRVTRHRVDPDHRDATFCGRAIVPCDAQDGARCRGYHADTDALAVRSCTGCYGDEVISPD